MPKLLSIFLFLILALFINGSADAQMILHVGCKFTENPHEKIPKSVITCDAGFPQALCTTTRVDCGKQCNENNDCQSFQHETKTNRCVMTKTEPVYACNSTTHDVGTKGVVIGADNLKTSENTYKMYYGQDSHGGSYPSHTYINLKDDKYKKYYPWNNSQIEGCQKVCDESIPRCDHFTLNLSSGACHLKYGYKANVGLHSSPSVVTGFKEQKK